MGTDKAGLLVEGEPLAERIVRLLAGAGWPVTVLGREPVRGAGFLADEAEHQGPMACLRRFAPTADIVFVCSCDLVRFDPRLGEILAGKLGDRDAAVPILEGRFQPLCAVYNRRAFDPAKTPGARVLDWLSGLSTVEIDEAELVSSGIDPLAAMGANSPGEFRSMLGKG